MSIETIISLLTALGVGGVLGALLNRRFEQQRQTNDHDNKIFHQSNEILSEQDLFAIANIQLLGENSIEKGAHYKLEKWCNFFEQMGNQYLDRKISAEKQKLLDDLNRLVKFVDENFFSVGGQTSRKKDQYLRPEWNEEHGGDPGKKAEYNKYAKELKDLTEDVVSQYSKYRLAIKRRLKI